MVRALGLVSKGLTLPAPGVVQRSVQFALIAVWGAGLLWWEHRRSLRPVVDSKVRRDVRNLAIAGLAAIPVVLLESPVAMAIANRAEKRHFGLVWLVAVPGWARKLIALLLLDYTLYGWHRMTHQVPLLWRFHRVHHADREMDASTALRFHFGEMTLSVAFRAVQVALIGPPLQAYAAWQTFLFLCILFHHGNVRLPEAVERRLWTLVMTPRLHGIHHSVVSCERDSNWSSGFTVWDWLHGTLRTNVPQEAIVIGVEGLGDDRHQQLGQALLLPFRAADVPVPARKPVG